MNIKHRLSHVTFIERTDYVNPADGHNLIETARLSLLKAAAPFITDNVGLVFSFTLDILHYSARPPLVPPILPKRELITPPQINEHDFVNYKETYTGLPKVEDLFYLPNGVVMLKLITHLDIL